jgi:type I restriction enzyme S subunit
MSNAALSGKYGTYPEYKDSVIEWLGEIPTNWNVLKHKYIASFTKGKNPESLKDVKDDGVFPYLSMDVLRGNSVEKYASFLKGMYLVGEKQPLIIWDGSNAGEFVKGKVGILSSTMAAVTLSYPIEPQYYWYLCLCVEPEMRKHAIGMGIPHVNGDELKKIELPIPLTNEQTQIANFLDYETSKIDTLIDNQQQLIKLLKEKRQAVISHAVTKGLNPDAVMKDSGVEWLGEVPAHWGISRVKHITTLFEQGWSPQCDTRPAESNEYGVLKVGCVNYGKFKNQENKALPSELEPRLQYLVKKGDLLISRANTKELVGSAAVIDIDVSNLILCDKLYRLRLLTSVLPDLLSLYLSIHSVREQIELGATGASHSMQNIGQDTIKELHCLIPPQEEAQNLLGLITESTSKFDEILSKSKYQVELLKERRTALISAAVTGKIDVRHFTLKDGNV